MKKLMKVTLLLMAIMTVLTLIYAGAVAYKMGYADGELHAHEYSVVKHPTHYNIWRHYFAEKLETEPEEWYTPEELGIVLIPGYDDYDIYIVDKEKALAWMRDGEFTPHALKYQDEFYRISFLWVTPGLGEWPWRILIGGVLGLGWIFTGALLLKERKKE